MIEAYLIVFFISVLPWVELRGSIPIGILVYHLNPLAVFALAVIANALVYFPAHFGLTHFYRIFKRYKFIERIVEGSRRRAAPTIKKYGYPGLFLFVGVPLPFTGAWTGTLIAWLFGMDRKKAFIAIAAGVLAAGVAVLCITLLAAGLLGWIGVAA